MTVVLASWILIVESGGIFDVIVDTVALLFLLDINGILLIYKSGGGSSGCIMTSPNCAKQLVWTRHQFHRLMCWLTLFLVPLVHFVALSSFDYQHPSILLNPLVDRAFLCPKIYLSQDSCIFSRDRPLGVVTYAVANLVVLLAFIIVTFTVILSRAGSATKTLESINGKRFGGGQHKVKSKEKEKVEEASKTEEKPDDVVTSKTLDQRLQVSEK